MNGSVLSRWSRYARALPTALVLGSLAVLPACAGKAGQTSSTPAPKDTPSQTASAEPKKPTEAQKPAEPAPKPAEPAPQPKPDTVASAPKPVDSTAVAAEFCKEITEGAQAAIKADSSLTNLDAAVRKIAGGVPDETVSIAFARKTTCR